MHDDINDIIVFDNWRVMHGRSAFEGIRRICGAYSESCLCMQPDMLTDLSFVAPRDDFMSRYRETNFPHETIIGRNLNMRSRQPTESKQEYEAITRAP